MEASRRRRRIGFKPTANPVFKPDGGSRLPHRGEEAVAEMQLEYLRRLYESIGRWAEIETERFYDVFKYDDYIPAGESIKLLDAYGYGILWDTVASITMPDDTEPDVGFIVVFDGSEIEDWSCVEYYSLLGFYPPIGVYAGCSMYDTVNRRYAWYVWWETKYLERLEVYLMNWTDVDVAVDVWDVQFQGRHIGRLVARR